MKIRTAETRKALEDEDDNSVLPELRKEERLQIKTELWRIQAFLGSIDQPLGQNTRELLWTLGSSPHHYTTLSINFGLWVNTFIYTPEYRFMKLEIS